MKNLTDPSGFELFCQIPQTKEFFFYKIFIYINYKHFQSQKMQKYSLIAK